MPEFKADVASVKLVYRYRQSNRLGPRRAVVMIYNQTLILRAALHSSSAEQAFFQWLAVRVQNQNRHLRHDFADDTSSLCKSNPQLSRTNIDEI